MKKIDKKRILICLGLIVVVLMFMLYIPVIFQEGNPTPIIQGIVKLNFSQDKIVKLNTKEDKYLTKSQNGKTELFDLLNNQEYKFLDQMGSGYFFKNDKDNKLIATHKYYSRFYSIWTITKSKNVKESIQWLDYENKEYSFILRYPSLSIDNKFWGGLPEGLSTSDVLLPNQILNKGNNFYFHQKYDISLNWQTGEFIKTENTFIPECIRTYPLPWHIIILEVHDEVSLDKVIKQKLGSGCSYKSKILTEFNDNYKVEIVGDGKDLGSTACPVNYQNYIIYSPAQGKVAFWSTGQECQIGLGFIYPDCFDQSISNSFHFTD